MANTEGILGFKYTKKERITGIILSLSSYASFFYVLYIWAIRDNWSTPNFITMLVAVYSMFAEVLVKQVRINALQRHIKEHTLPVKE